MHIRYLRRPEPRSERARTVVEWAEVIYYVFVLIYSAAMLVILAVHAPEILFGLR